MTTAFGAFTIAALPVIVVVRALVLQRRGITAIRFGAINRSDFLIPPFAAFYIYLILAHAFGWPSVAHEAIFAAPAAGWLGVVCCLCGIALFVASLISFGTSFRVGIDTERPDALVTSGIFTFTRNPMYVAFSFVLLGEFLIFPHWLLLAYLVAGSMLMHRQVLLEEAFLRAHYGAAYDVYAARVRRYL